MEGNGGGGGSSGGANGGGGIGYCAGGTGASIIELIVACGRDLGGGGDGNGGAHVHYFDYYDCS